MIQFVVNDVHTEEHPKLGQRLYRFHLVAFFSMHTVTADFMSVQFINHHLEICIGNEFSKNKTTKYLLFVLDLLLTIAFNWLILSFNTILFSSFMTWMPFSIAEPFNAFGCNSIASSALVFWPPSAIWSTIWKFIRNVNARIKPWFVFFLTIVSKGAFRAGSDTKFQLIFSEFRRSAIGRYALQTWHEVLSSRYCII